MASITDIVRAFNQLSITPPEGYELRNPEEIKDLIAVSCQEYAQDVGDSFYGGAKGAAQACYDQKFKDVPAKNNVLFAPKKTVVNPVPATPTAPVAPANDPLNRISQAADIDALEGVLGAIGKNETLGTAFVKKAEALCAGQTRETCGTPGTLDSITDTFKGTFGADHALTKRVINIGTGARAPTTFAPTPGGHVGSRLGLNPAGTTTYPTANCGVTGYSTPLSPADAADLAQQCQDPGIYQANTTVCAPCAPAPTSAAPNRLGLAPAAPTATSSWADAAVKRGYTLGARFTVGIPLDLFTLDSGAPDGGVASVPGGYSPNAYDPNNQSGYGAFLGGEFEARWNAGVWGGSTVPGLGAVFSIDGARMKATLTDPQDVETANAGAGLAFGDFSLVRLTVMPKASANWEYGSVFAGVQLGGAFMFSFEDEAVLESPRDGGVGDDYEDGSGFIAAACGGGELRFGGETGAFSLSAGVCYMFMNQLKSESDQGGV